MPVPLLSRIAAVAVAAMLLLQSKSAIGDDVEISVERGVATLAGTVNDAARRREPEELAPIRCKIHAKYDSSKRGTKC